MDEKEKSTPSSSLPAGGTQNEPLQEEKIEVRVDHTGNTLSPEKDARIFEVVTDGKHQELSELLTSDTTSVYAIDKGGNTALHRAVASACQKGVSDDSFYHCIDRLMSCEQLKVNMQNKKGFTAIGLAVHHLHRKCTERMLKHPSAKPLHLDYYPGDRESTVREIIMETFPDLEAPLPAPLMESLDSHDSDKKLLAALQDDKYCTLKDNLELNNPNPWYGEPYYSSLLETACQMKNRKEFVELLLDNGADPKIKNRVTGMPLIHATARSGNFEVLKILLEKEGEKDLEDNELRTILHWLAGVSDRKSKKRLEDCLNLLLHPECSWKVDTEDRDRSGKTALYIAVERGFRYTAKLLLSKGADVGVFKRGSKILLSDSASIVEEFLDDCLQSNDKPLTSIDLQLTLKYQPLNNIVLRIAESKLHSHLLTHPVMSSFLILKWKNLRFVFLSDVAFYLAFLFFLTTYILYCDPHNTLNDGGAASNTTDHFSSNDSNITSGMNESNVLPQLKWSDQFFLWLCLMALLFLLTLRESVQLFVHRWVHLQSPENWLEMLLIIATFISCSGVAEGEKIKLHSSAFALLLGWFELLLLLGRLPSLSVQHKMFKKVSRSFLWYMMGYAPLLIAFALSFYILFKEWAEPEGTYHILSPLLSLSKTIIMFSGEFDASDLSFETLAFTSHVIFLLFVVLVAIILLNLLNGLAVNDTEEIANVAKKLSLESRVRLLSRIEGLVNILPKHMKPDIELKKEMFVIYPNRWNRIGSSAVQSLLSIISEKTKPGGKDKSTEFRKELRMFAEKLSQLQKKFESMLDE